MVLEFRVSSVFNPWLELLRTLAGDPDDRIPTEADLATVPDAARLLERAYRRFEELRPTLTPERLNTVMTKSEARKLKIRNPKHEIRNNLKARNLKSQTKENPMLRTWVLGIWDLFRISDFGFRICSVFGFVSHFEVRVSDFVLFFWVIEQIPQEASPSRPSPQKKEN